MKRIIWLTVTTVMLSGGLSEGLSGQTPRMLTFDQALEQMMRANPAIRALEHEERAAELERRAAVGLYFPSVDVAGTYTYMSKDIGVDLNDLKQPIGNLLEGVAPALPAELVQQAQMLMKPSWSMTIQDREMAFVGGSVTMPVFMGGKIAAANRAARINESAVEQKGIQTRNTLVSQLAEYYYGLALVRQVAAVRQQVVDGMRRHLDDALALERNGMIASSERLYAEGKMADAERELIRAESLVRTLTDALGSLLNEDAQYLPVSTLFILDGLEDVAYYRSLAADKNPMLRQVSLKKELAGTAVRAQAAEFMPQVVLTGATMLANHNYSPHLPRWVVGAGVRIKIFDGLHREHKFSAAKQTVRQIGALETQAGNEIGVLIGKLYYEVRSYRDQMEPIETSLRFAHEYLRAKELTFREGVGSSADVVDAQLNLARLRTERMQNAYYFDLMLARLLEASGVSDRFAEYARRSDAVSIQFE